MFVLTLNFLFFAIMSLYKKLCTHHHHLISPMLSPIPDLNHWVGNPWQCILRQLSQQTFVKHVQKDRHGTVHTNELLLLRINTLSKKLLHFALELIGVTVALT